MNIFGFEITKSNKPVIPSPVQPQSEGELTLTSSAYNYTSQVVDLENVAKDENSLIRRYREIAQYADCQEAIDDIMDEAIIQEGNEDPITINLDKLSGLDPKIQELLMFEFRNVLELLKFGKKAQQIFRKWYIDGRIYFQILLDEKDTKYGIVEVRPIDPRKIKKIKEITKGTDPKTGSEIVQGEQEYYIYNDKGLAENMGKGQSPTQTSSMSYLPGAGDKLSPDSVAYVHSGLVDDNSGMVLGYLHAAIKPTNQLKMMEDSFVIYFISRAPERRIFYIDVGGLPKEKVEQYVQDVMNKYRNKLSYDVTTGDLKDERKFMCLAMDTKIPLLDGRVLTISEIEKEIKDNKKLWVYSCNPITGAFEPGLVSWAGKTKDSAAVMKITLDNGKSVICTPEHKFPIWGKGFVEAKDVFIGESMIPLYKDYNPLFGDSKGKKYESILNNVTNEWQYTHRVVESWKKQHNINEEYIYSEKYVHAKKNIIHHKNCNRFDNSPENLVKMNMGDHFKYHSDMAQQYVGENQKILYPTCVIAEVISLLQTKKTKRQILESLNQNSRLIEQWKSFNENQYIKTNKLVNFTHKDLNRIAIKSNFSCWVDMRKQYQPSKITVSKTMRAKRGSDLWKQRLSVSSKNRKSSSSTKIWKISTPDSKVIIIENLNQFCRENNLNRNNIKRDYGSKKYFATKVINHKITNIEFLDERMDVGTLSIDQNEIYHNHHTFALNCGIYTKNSILEDFWIPRRSDKTTEITTLQGGSNLMNINEQLMYFQTKLYQALKVPVSRRQQGDAFNLGRSSEITRDEIKFHKFINRLRNQFSTLFNILLRVQLVAKGIIRVEEWDQFEQKIQYDFKEDNVYSEFKDSELKTQRMNLLGMASQFVGSYFSKEWIFKEILRFNEEETREMMEQIAAEVQAGIIIDPNMVQQQEMEQNEMQAQQDMQSQRDEQKAKKEEAKAKYGKKK